jgi:hypothetical protein
LYEKYHFFLVGVPDDALEAQPESGLEYRNVKRIFTQFGKNDVGKIMGFCGCASYSLRTAKPAGDRPEPDHF